MFTVSNVEATDFLMLSKSGDQYSTKLSNLVCIILAPNVIKRNDIGKGDKIAQCDWPKSKRRSFPTLNLVKPTSNVTPQVALRYENMNDLAKIQTWEVKPT